MVSSTCQKFLIILQISKRYISHPVINYMTKASIIFIQSFLPSVENKAHFQCPLLIRHFILNSKSVPNNIKWGGENNRKCQGECETNSVYGLDFLSARFCIVLAWFRIWFEVPGALQRFLSFLVLSKVYEHAFSSIWFLSLWFTFMSIAARGILVCVVLWLCWLKISMLFDCNPVLDGAETFDFLRVVLRLVSSLNTDWFCAWELLALIEAIDSSRNEHLRWNNSSWVIFCCPWAL